MPPPGIRIHDLKGATGLRWACVIRGLRIRTEWVVICVGPGNHEHRGSHFALTPTETLDKVIKPWVQDVALE